MLLGAWPLGGKNSIPPAKNGKGRFLILIGIYSVFIILGAAIFSSIEAPKMADLADTIQSLRTKFTQSNKCLSASHVHIILELRGLFNTGMSAAERVTLLSHRPKEYRRKGSLLYNALIGKRDCKQYASCDSFEHKLFPPLTVRGSADNFCDNKSGNSFENDPLLPSTFRVSQPHKGNSICLRSLSETRKENIWLALYLILYIGFLCIGSVFFAMLETGVEQSMKDAFRISKAVFLAKYPQVQDDDLEAFLVEVVKANDRGISPLRNASAELNWSFGQALFFASTVVTTIGYGRVTPLSQTGKIFCMIYATIGIPLTLVLLTAVVERLLLPASWLLGKLNSKLGHLYQPFNIRLMHLSIIILIIAVLFFMIPTAVFAYLEPSWGVLDAFYYCFISLTTIGLGDYIPGEGVAEKSRSLYKICITIYLICGLIAMMLALTIFYDIPQLNLGQLFTESSGSESERLRLSGSGAPCYSGPSGLYIPQRDEEVRRAVVRIRPHGDESPSPDEPLPPSAQKDAIP